MNIGLGSYDAETGAVLITSDGGSRLYVAFDSPASASSLSLFGTDIIFKIPIGATTLSVYSSSGSVKGSVMVGQEV